MNDNEKLEHFITCLRAEIEGKTIQSLIGLGWMDCHRAGVQHLSFNVFNASNWRVKPDAPKVVPWDFETAPAVEKAIRKTDRMGGLVQAWPNFVLFMEPSGGSVRYTYPAASEQFELLDGRPYGIEQKEESEEEWAIDKDGDIWKCEENGFWRVFRKEKGFLDENEEANWGWSEIVKSYEARRIPAAEAERIIANAKEAK